MIYSGTRMWLLYLVNEREDDRKLLFGGQFTTTPKAGQDKEQQEFSLIVDWNAK